MIVLNGVGGVEQTPDLGWIIKKGGQGLPLVFPGANGAGIFVAPEFTQLQQLSFGLCPGRRLVDFFQVVNKRFLVFRDNIVKAWL